MEERIDPYPRLEILVETICRQENINNERVKEFFLTIQRSDNQVVFPILIFNNGLRYEISPKIADDYTKERRLATEQFPTLYINDLPLFLKKLAELENEIQKVSWYQWHTLHELWINGTWADFQNPIQFMDALLFEILHGTVHIPKHDLGENSLYPNSRLFIDQTYVDPEYESPNNIGVAIAERAEYGLESKLPLVRYGFFKPDGATIYAIQLEKRVGLKGRKIVRQELKTLVRDVNQIVLDLRNLIQTKPAVEDLCPPLLSVAQPAMDDFTQQLQYMENVIEAIAQDCKDNHYIDDIEIYNNNYLIAYYLRAKEEELLQSRNPDLNQGELNTLIIELSRVLGALSRVNDEYINLSEQLNYYSTKFRLNQLLTERLAYKTTQQNEVAELGSSEVLETAPPAALLSLVTSLALLQKNGVKTVRVPLYLPLREHIDNNEIDDRIQKQLITLFYRAEHELHGFKHVQTTEDEAETGYMYFSLGEISAKNNDLLAEVIQAVNKSFKQYN